MTKKSETTAICSIGTCCAKHFGRGFCQKHYVRWRTHGDPNIVLKGGLAGKLHPSYKHGMTRSPIYCCWNGMKNRCFNKKKENYKHYGARGITMCKRWIDSFEEFYRDMSGSYWEGASIERIDNNGNYCPENCKWIPRSEQTKNRRPYSEWNIPKLNNA